MARFGTFGRAPRAAPNIQAVLLSIAREEENRRDQNIMDAWEHGGTFEGKPVTDKVVLAHWKDRLDGVSKDDPLYDTYKNAVEQAEYSIEASKMTARYAQGRASDGEMVRFYMRWARKVPKDSEFYRQLQRDAGQYMNRAQARSQSDINAAKEKAYLNSQDRTAAKYVAPWAFLTDVLTYAAQKDGILESSGIPGEKSQDLFAMAGEDPGRLVGLINKLFGTTPGQFAGPSGLEGSAKAKAADKVTANSADDTIIYVDPNTGKAWTKAEVVARWGDLNPDGGPISLATYRNAARTAREGTDILIGKANRTGHATDARNHEKTKEYTTATQMMVGDLDIVSAYTDAHRSADAVISQGRPAWEVVEAGDKFDSNLLRLAAIADKRGDYVLGDRLRDEAEGQTGQNSIWEDLNGKDGRGAGDTADTKMTVESARAAIEDVKAGKKVWVQARMDSSGQFVPSSGGTTFIAMDPAEARDVAPMMKPVTIATKGGTTQSVMVIIEPITIVGPDGKPQPVGFVADVPMSPVGKPTRLYGHQSDLGVEPVWDDTPFWDERATPSHSGDGGRGIILEPPANAPRFVNGQIVDARGTPQAQSPAGYDIEYSASGAPTIVMSDPMGVIRSTNPARFSTTGGTPYGDSPSLTLAAAKAQADANIARTVFASPEGSRQIDSDVHAFAGDTVAEVIGDPGSFQQTVWNEDGDPRARSLAGLQTSALVRATTNGRWGLEAINELDAVVKPVEEERKAAEWVRPASGFAIRDISKALNTQQLSRAILTPREYGLAQQARKQFEENANTFLGDSGQPAALRFGAPLTVPTYTPSFEPGKTYGPSTVFAPTRQKDTVVPGSTYGPTSLSGSGGSSGSSGPYYDPYAHGK